MLRETDEGTKFFDKTDVSLHTGTPVRNEQTCKAGFRFEDSGLATWLFIIIDEA